MYIDESCRPARTPRCRTSLVAAAFVLVAGILVAAEGILLAHAGLTLKARIDEAGGRLDRIAARAAALDASTADDIHAVRRQLVDADRRLRAELAREGSTRKADLARLDNRITDALTRDVAEAGNIIADLMRKVEGVNMRVSLLAASAGRERCRCGEIGPPPKLPPPPGKGLPRAIPPR